MKSNMSIFDKDGKFRKLRFEYKNWKGKTSLRTVTGQPLIWYGNTDYHPEPQWFMTAYDADKGQIRDFALKDIIKYVD